MNFFDEATLRLKQQLAVTQDRDVAQFLGMTPRAWAGRKKNESFPETELYALLTKRPSLKIDVDYVLTGIPAAANKDEAIQRLKQQLHVEDDEAVAELLGLTASALADSPQTPIKAIFSLAEKRPDLGLDPDWIITGTSKKAETAGTLEVKITPHEMALIDHYRLSQKDVQRGVDALLAATAKKGDNQ